jgi:hypothetical protein
MNDADRALARQALVENDWDRYIDTSKLIQLARADEREAILELVDSYAKNNTDLADAIRARGQA